MSTSIPPIKESRRTWRVESRAISFPGLLRMSSSNSVRNSQSSRSFFEVSVSSVSLRERIVDTDEAGFESFMVLTLSATEALVMRRVWISKEASLVVAPSGYSPARPHVFTLCGLPHSSTIIQLLDCVPLCPNTAHRAGGTEGKLLSSILICTRFRPAILPAPYFLGRANPWYKEVYQRSSKLRRMIQQVTLLT